METQSRHFEAPPPPPPVEDIDALQAKPDDNEKLPDPIVEAFKADPRNAIGMYKNAPDPELAIRNAAYRANAGATEKAARQKQKRESGLESLKSHQERKKVDAIAKEAGRKASLARERAKQNQIDRRRAEVVSDNIDKMPSTELNRVSENKKIAALEAIKQDIAKTQAAIQQSKEKTSGFLAKIFKRKEIKELKQQQARLDRLTKDKERISSSLPVAAERVDHAPLPDTAPPPPAYRSVPVEELKPGQPVPVIKGEATPSGPPPPAEISYATAARTETPPEAPPPPPVLEPGEPKPDPLPPLENSDKTFLGFDDIRIPPKSVDLAPPPPVAGLEEAGFEKTTPSIPVIPVGESRGSNDFEDTAIRESSSTNVEHKFTGQYTPENIQALVDAFGEIDVENNLNDLEKAQKALEQIDVKKFSDAIKENPLAWKDVMRDLKLATLILEEANANARHQKLNSALDDNQIFEIGKLRQIIAGGQEEAFAQTKLHSKKDKGKEITKESIQASTVEEFLDVYASGEIDGTLFKNLASGVRRLTDPIMDQMSLEKAQSMLDKIKHVLENKPEGIPQQHETAIALAAARLQMKVEEKQKMAREAMLDKVKTGKTSSKVKVVERKTNAKDAPKTDMKAAAKEILSISPTADQLDRVLKVLPEVKYEDLNVLSNEELQEMWYVLNQVHMKNVNSGVDRNDPRLVQLHKNMSWINYFRFQEGRVVPKKATEETSQSQEAQRDLSEDEQISAEKEKYLNEAEFDPTNIGAAMKYIEALDLEKHPDRVRTAIKLLSRIDVDQLKEESTPEMILGLRGIIADINNAAGAVKSESVSKKIHGLDKSLDKKKAQKVLDELREENTLSAEEEASISEIRKFALKTPTSPPDAIIRPAA